DRRALPDPAEQIREPGGLEAQPRTPLEEILCEVWGSVLQHSRVGIHDNFFELGGHSLSATRVVARLSSLLRLELPLRDLFEAPTVAQLAGRIEQALRVNQVCALAEPLVQTNLQQAPLSFAQQRLWFLEQLQPGTTAYLITSAHHLQGPLHLAALEESLAELVRRHASLRTTFGEHEGQPFQVIHPAGGQQVPLIDLHLLPEAKRADAARLLAQQEARHPCDLATGPLVRAS